MFESTLVYILNSCTTIAINDSNSLTSPYDRFNGGTIVLFAIGIGIYGLFNGLRNPILNAIIADHSHAGEDGELMWINQSYTSSARPWAGNGRRNGGDLAVYGLFYPKGSCWPSYS